MHLHDLRDPRTYIPSMHVCIERREKSRKNMKKKRNACGQTCSVPVGGSIRLVWSEERGGGVPPTGHRPKKSRKGPCLLHHGSVPGASRGEVERLSSPGREMTGFQRHQGR